MVGDDRVDMFRAVALESECELADIETPRELLTKVNGSLAA